MKFNSYAYKVKKYYEPYIYNSYCGDKRSYYADHVR